MIHPPTVEPGATGVSRLSTLIIESPRGAPVSNIASEKSVNFFPSLLLDLLPSQ